MVVFTAAAEAVAAVNMPQSHRPTNSKLTEIKT